MTETGTIAGNLIIVDGIAGSGKSITGQKLYRVLHLNGYPVQFYHEFYRPHPVLEVEAASTTEWIDQSLSKWRSFVHSLTDPDTVTILDGAIFQCGIGELLERDTDDQTAINYIDAVMDIIGPANPVLIHLYQGDIEAAVKRIRALRPAAWVERVDAYLAGTKYGRSRSMSGFELYLDFNKSLRRISDSLFELFEMAGLSIDNSDLHWDAHFDKICRFLGSSPKTDPFCPGDYCGEYDATDNHHPCRIEVIDGNFRVEGLFKLAKNLMPKLDDTVFVQSWPDELTFRRNSRGIVESFCSTGPWDRLGKGTWIRRTTE